MDSNKNSKSNKIRDIVRLQQILKKWRKQASSSSSSKPANKSNNINKFLKRTLSISSESSAATCSSSNVVVPRKGYLAVSVGEEMKRFIIPTEYLEHQAFHLLLREAEEEFGFQQGAGVLRIPCEVAVFETILKLVELDKKKKLQILIDANISSSSSSPLLLICSSSSSSMLHQTTPSHHPQSPMCR